MNFAHFYGLITRRTLPLWTKKCLCKDRSVHDISRTLTMSKKVNMEKKAKAFDYSQVKYRLAEPTDYEEVMILCKTALRGRDVVPASYFHYLKDPRRRLWVAVHQEKVVSLVGMKFIDDGTVVEGNLARSLPSYPGVYNRLRAYAFGPWIAKEYPWVKRLRAIVRSNKFFVRTSLDYSIVLSRKIITLAWKIPPSKMTDAIAKHQNIISVKPEPQIKLRLVDREDISRLFKDAAFRSRYIPTGLLLIDGSAIRINHPENIEIVMGGSDRKLFAHYDTGSQLQSLSIGSVCEMGIDMATLRCHIDFYGPADIDTVVVHIMKHIAAIQPRLAESKTAKDVYLAIIVNDRDFDEVVTDKLFQATSALRLTNSEAIKTIEHYYVTEMSLPLAPVGQSKL